MDDIEYIQNLPLSVQEKEQLITRFKNLQKLSEISETKYLAMERNIAENIISSLFNDSKDYVHVVDIHGTILNSNQAAVEGLGYSLEEIKGKHIKHFLHPKYHPDFNKLFPELKKTGHVQTEVEVIHKSGKKIAVEGRGVALFNEQGKIICIIVFRRDISELKRSQEKIRESEELFKIFMDTLPGAIFIKDSESRAIFLNKYFTEHLVSTNWENKKPTDLFSDDVAAMLRSNDLLAMKEGLMISEDSIRDKQGLKRIFHTIKFPIHQPDKPTLLGGIALDITNRKEVEDEIIKREAELVESQKLFALFMENIPGFIYLKDLTGRYLFANKATEDLHLGQNWQNKTHHEIFNSEVAAEITEEDKQVLLDGSMDKEEDNFIDKAGHRRIMRNIKFLIKRPSKDPLIGGIGFDITENKKLEEELLKIQKLESIGLLAGGIAHDFNNILTSIMGNLSLIKFDLHPGTDLYESIKQIEKSTFRAKDLTNQLLTFSKGGAPLKKAVDIKEIIRESANFILRGSNVKCNFEFASTLFPVELDKGQFNQVLNNLMINADQAMPLGGYLTIRVSNKLFSLNNRFSLSMGEYIEIMIEDQGAGIPPENFTKIFTPYFTTKQKGSGLGLATSFSIIKRHGGTITFKSVLGQGAIFYIYLPASSNNNIGIITSKAKTMTQNLNLKVLVMDDEVDVIRIVEKMLKKLNCDPYRALDGHEAIAIFSEEYAAGRPFDCVILDLTIPGGLGGEITLKKIREIDPNILVIVSSGYSTDPIMANYKDYGFNWAIPKPYTMSTLLRILQKIHQTKKM